MIEWEQIDKWTKEGRFAQIVSALEDIPESELEYKYIRSLGLAYNNTGRLGDAINILNTVFDIGENDPVWNYFLGYALLYTECYEEAREAFLRAVELDPANPAHELLQHCICFDDTPEAGIDNHFVAGCMTELITCSLKASSIKPPETIQFSVEINELKKVNDNFYVATLYFYIDNKSWNKQIFECASGSGNCIKGAIGSALSSFYMGIFSVIKNVLGNKPFKHVEVRDIVGNPVKWAIYSSQIGCMGEFIEAKQNHYWDFIEPKLENYLGNNKLNYIKIYNAKGKKETISESRINNHVSCGLKNIFLPYVEAWENTEFASHKQFFILVNENAVTEYPYTQDDIYKFARAAVFMFADQNTDNEDIVGRLTKTFGDASLSNELYGFIPEICAFDAFRDIHSPDTFSISIPNASGCDYIPASKWRITSYFMIQEALDKGFRSGDFPENAFLKCVQASSTYSAVNVAHKNNSSITGEVATVYGFGGQYTPR